MSIKETVHCDACDGWIGRPPTENSLFPIDKDETADLCTECVAEFLHNELPLDISLGGRLRQFIAAKKTEKEEAA